MQPMLQSDLFTVFRNRKSQRIDVVLGICHALDF